MEIPAGGGSAASANVRTTWSRRTSSILGTHTSTDTRRTRISRRRSCGLKLRVKMTVPRTIGGTLVGIGRRGRVGNVFAREQDARADEPSNLGDEIGRRPIVDRDNDDAGDETPPVAGDPLRPVLAPEDDFVALVQSRNRQLDGKPSR